VLASLVSGFLEVAALRKLFPVGGGRRLHALDGVDFVLREGESLGIVGESGSGKSTLARLIAGLADPTSGAIRFEGRDIAGTGARNRTVDRAYQDIQLVFQNVGDSLNPAFTAARNIAVGLRRTSLDARTRAIVERIAGEAGIGLELLDRRPHQLSGGQQARIGLARALAAEPRLLILDEPTAPLDVSVQATILKLIDALRRKRGLSLLFISHDLEVVRLMCDRVMVLYLGRIAEIGPVDQILRAPRHPYTRALIGARPGHGRPVLLPGEAASPIDPAPGACLFANRCSLAEARCAEERPGLTALGVDHFAACLRL
jgi:oligopeptide/dipeptide ABC transporter ATP-binding protein